MALEPIKLDTLNWNQITTGIRTRIPANSQGQWTLHAPVDPGITLLELFAWIFDQRIYWMDQIPDALILATLRLLGEEPRSAKPAVTVIQLSDTKRVPGSYTVAPAGTVMRCGNLNPPLLFTLQDDIIVLPVAVDNGTPDGEPLVSITVNGVDRTSDLKHGRAVALLPRKAASGSIKISLVLEEEVPTNLAEGQLAFFVELENPADIKAEWLADDSTTILPPAQLQWSYRALPQGQRTVIPPEEIQDGTGGLRRSGIVRLPKPKDWQPAPATAPNQKPVYTLVLEIENATYAATPRLLRICPNAVVARHTWARVKQVKTKDWLSLPGNVISFSSLSGSSEFPEFPPIEDSVKLRVVERDGQAHEDWVRASDFSFSGPSDRVFVVDRLRGEIRFGDGLTGRLPVLLHGTDSEIQLTYLAGGGEAGNIGATLEWTAIRSNAAGPSPRLSGVNLVPGDNGAESESLLNAQQRVAGLLRERNRAVTGPDYELLAETTPGAGFVRAYAQAGFDPEFPCQTVPGTISVFVIPYAPREEDEQSDSELFVPAPQPDPGALGAARARLNGARLIGTKVYVLPPVYRSVWLEVDVSADAVLSSTLRQQIAFRLRRFLDPLVGGSNGEGWPFGDPIRPTALIREAQIVLADAADVDRIWVRISGMDAAVNCLDVEIGAHELPKLEQVDVRVKIREALAGGLR